MGTETASAAPMSKPAALMRAAQAIVERRKRLAAEVPSLGGGDGTPSAGINARSFTDATPRAPDPGAQSFQAQQVQPGRLLDSIDTFTGPVTDGSGYQVRHADSGRLIAQGDSAQEADARAQDLAGWLGRRRMVAWLQSDSAPPQAAPLDDNTATGSAVLGSGTGLAHSGKKALVDNPELIKRWESTRSAWTGKGGFSPQFVQLLESHGIEVDPSLKAINPAPVGSLSKTSGVSSGKANNVNGRLAEDAIADRYRNAGYDEVQTRVRKGNREIDVSARLRAADPRYDKRIETESKVGRVTSEADYVKQAAKDAQALVENRGVRMLGHVSEGLGRVAIPVGIALDAKELHDAYQADGGIIGQHTERAASGIAGGAAGGWAGAVGGAAAGAALGTFVMPVVGTAIGGVAGGLIGGFGGGIGGTAIGHELFDRFAQE